MVRNCRLVENFADYGGAIYTVYGNPIIIGCTMVRNTSNHGGAVYSGDPMAASIVRISNCVIAANSAAPSSLSRGGAVYVANSRVDLINCTITGNCAGIGGAICCDTANATVNLVNSLAWDDTGITGSEIYARGTVSVSYCDVQRGLEGAYVVPGGTLNWGDGNIDADPQFAFSTDYRLLRASPCIDAGTNTPLGGLPPSDADGVTRPRDGNGDGTAVADMGAYELDGAAPCIAFTSDRFAFTVAADSGVSAAQGLSLRNCGAGTLNWQIVNPCGWLNLAPVAGQAAYADVDAVEIRVDSTGLAPGRYACEVQITDWQASNSPRPVDIVVNVRTPLRVPQDFATIAAAISAAQPGDLIVVGDGTYTGTGNINLQITTSGLTLRGEQGPRHCIIDCAGAGRALTFGANVKSDTVLEGFTVTNGFQSSERGGALHCDGSPTIRNCILRANRTVANGGGAVDCSASRPQTFENCIFAENVTFNGGGAIMSSASGHVTLRNCLFAANRAHYGGAISAFGRVFDMDSCTIVNNVANVRGGGLDCGGSSEQVCSYRLRNSILWNNAAPVGAQAALYGDGEVPLTLSIMHSDVQGGPSAVYLYQNSTVAWGAGSIDAEPAFAFLADPHPLPRSPCIDAGSNWLAAVPADLDGRPRGLDGNLDGDRVVDMGAYELDPVTPAIALSADTLDFAAQLDGTNPPDQTLSIRNAGGGTLQREISGAVAWLTVLPTSGQSTGEINDVELYADITGLSRGVYRCALTVSDPHAANTPRTVVLRLRVLGVLHVPTEYTTIQAAIDAAIPGEIVQLADGTYTGTGNKNLTYRGKPITVRSESGPASCVVDCQGTGLGVRFDGQETSSAVLDGVTIANAGANAYAAVYCAPYSSPTIRNCWITGSARPGISCSYSGAVTVEHCTIVGNVVGLNLNFATACVVRDCIIHANHSSNSGGGICVSQSDPLIERCVVSGNQARYGAGLSLLSSFNGKVKDCLIFGNTATQGGGGVYQQGGVVLYENVTVAQNQSVSYGGGLYGDGTQSGRYLLAQLANYVFWNNSATGGGHQLAVVAYGRPDTLSVAYSDVEGGASGVFVEGGATLIWGAGNIDVDPPFVDPNNGNFHVTAGSPCIDAGDPNFVPAPGETDLDGNKRVWDGHGTGTAIVDMGAYEFGSHPYGDLNCDGVINFADIDPFVLALSDHAGYQAQYPNCNWLLADINGDGLVNFADIDPFVAILSGGG